MIRAVWRTAAILERVRTVRFWLPASMREITDWVVPTALASCPWVMRAFFLALAICKARRTSISAFAFQNYL